jgi:hypothetical protein
MSIRADKWGQLERAVEALIDNDLKRVDLPWATAYKVGESIRIDIGDPSNLR